MLLRLALGLATGFAFAENKAGDTDAGTNRPAACHSNLIIALGEATGSKDSIPHISLPEHALRLLQRVSSGTANVTFSPAVVQPPSTQVVFPLGPLDPRPQYESIFGRHQFHRMKFDLLPRPFEAAMADPKDLIEAIRLTRRHGMWVFVSSRSPEAVGNRLPSGHMFSLIGDWVFSRNSGDANPFDVIDVSALDWDKTMQSNSLHGLFPSPFHTAEWTTATFLEFGQKETAILGEAMRARTQDPSLIGKYLPLPTHKHYGLSVASVTTGEVENCTYATFALATTRMRQRFPQLDEIVVPLGTGLTLQDLPYMNIPTVAELPNARGTFFVVRPEQAAP
jgi:hypothetical protein